MAIFPRALRAATLGLAAALLAGSCAPVRRTPPPVRWSVSYWCWKAPQDRLAPAPPGKALDALYVQAGRFAGPAVIENRWPRELPPAREYLAVWRSDLAAPPDPALVPRLSRAYREVKAHAAARGERIAGLQLDVDCPTASLAAYARFLRALRAALHREDRLSITALLDWFRPGTGVEEVVAAADEYVPQFYDVDPGREPSRIAEPVDARRWAPVFDALERPYRIGLATFGRIERVRRAAVRAPFRDLTLLDVAEAGLDRTGAFASASGERIVSYRASRTASLPGIQLGDEVDVILPTPASLRAGYEAARSLGGWCVGVVLFRWPAAAEALVLTPTEVERVLSGGSGRAGRGEEPAPPRLVATDGGCVTRHCADLSIIPGSGNGTGTGLAPPRLYLRASADVDYVFPAAPGRLRRRGARLLAVAISPDAPARAVPLGRAFSRRPSRFELIVEQP